MIIRTESYKTLEYDIAKMFGMDKSTLYETLYRFERESKESDDYWDTKERLIEQFIKKQSRYDIDEVYVYHLSRLISIPRELKPLKELFSEENTLSEFLKEYGIEIVVKDEKLELYYKKEWIPSQKFYEGRGGCGRLANRFGQSQVIDFCVNGFLFWPDIEKTTDSYFIGLQKGPEIVQDLERFLEIDMTSEYKARSKYYGVVLRVPIENIFFDKNKEAVSKEDKRREFLKYALKTISGCYNADISSLNNPIVQFRDDENVPVDYVIEIPD